MEREKKNKLPEFQSLEEERKYWEARGPLAEGHRGRINKPKPSEKRSSFLAVRLTGEELTHLRNIAARQGLGPSTFARLILTSVIEHQSKLPKFITLDQLKDMLKDVLENKLPQSVKDKAEVLTKSVATGDPDSPSFLLMDVSQMKQAEEFTWSLFMALLSVMGVQIITPEDERYKEVRQIVKAQS